jgi:hypothetical protein
VGSFRASRWPLAEFQEHSKNDIDIDIDIVNVGECPANQPGHETSVTHVG